MIDLKFNSQTPGLLVSVRNLAEALTALNAGADVIDVKEPNRGALGAADAQTIAEIAHAVNGRAVVTAASGELKELATQCDAERPQPISSGVSLFKIGLAGCGRSPNWQSQWRIATAALQGDESPMAKPVAVVYADWQPAQAPNPDDILQAAVDLHCPALLIDTWDKSAGTLFDHWAAHDLRPFLDRVRSHQIAVVLAGSLSGDIFKQAVQLQPDLVAVRGAACDSGRNGVVSAERIRWLKKAITACDVSDRKAPLTPTS